MTQGNGRGKNLARNVLATSVVVGSPGLAERTTARTPVAGGDQCAWTEYAFFTLSLTSVVLPAVG